MTNSIPNSKPAEDALLASLMNDQTALYEALQLVQPADFHTAVNRMAFNAAVALFTRQQNINPLSISRELSAQEQDPKGTSYQYLTELASNHHNPKAVIEYASVIADTAIKRRIMELCETTAQLAGRDAQPADEIIHDAIQNLLDLGYGSRRNGHMIPLADLYNKFIDDTITDPTQSEADLDPGYDGLSMTVPALRPSDLIILGARPSVGKSSLALNIAVHAAQQQRTVAFFSLEMSAQQVALRILSAESEIPSHVLLQQALPQDQQDNIIRHTEKLSELQFYVDETPILTVPQVTAKCHALRIARGLDLIVVDYLQLLTVPDGNSSRSQRVQEISTISRQLKQLARELNVPVIACSQLSRATEARPGSRPQLSDLRESGTIEQDADIVLFLYRQDQVYNQQDWENAFPAQPYPESLAELIVAKHRNGPTGSSMLYFNEPIMRFDDHDPAISRLANEL